MTTTVAAEQTTVVSTKQTLNFINDIQIPHNLKNLSTYSKFLALYTRDSNTSAPHSMEEKQGCKFGENWSEFMELIKNNEPRKALLCEDIFETCLPTEVSNKFTNSMNMPLKISEYQKRGESQIRGCVTTVENENEFNDWFIFHILDQARLEASDKPFVPADISYHEIFADYFEKKLKNTVMEDQWNSQGRQYFIGRVRYFTDRFLRIECVLPAFPCKTSNRDKAAGYLPDKGEEFALRRLLQATEEVAKIYPPGMKVWIVSDGHVFSDCIGVDDDVVNTYTQNLHNMYQAIATPGLDSVGLCGLNDLFFSGQASPHFDARWIEDSKLEHYTGTKICSVSEASRAILMKGCDTDDGRLRKQIGISGHPRLHLFRGFARFMEEDLSQSSHFENSSRKRFKKVVSKVAFNMIKRNDAYSNLVELLFPHHLRFSIHAHTNSGPKFGIKVVSPEQCLSVKSLESVEEPKFEDLLHIPTPWHNCVVKLCNQDRYFLIKAKAVRDAMEKGTYVGVWKETKLALGEGGYYEISKS
ncbi:probable Spore wall maturation protein DIT1 [Zygosaccharomyces bailii]|nr:probable Spore wall maturation protein DIT1 [Zygosaccharomyces bailii]